MKNKLLAFGSLGLTCISLYMMCGSPYYPPLGDLLLEKLGIQSWVSAADNSEFHIALIYYLVLASIGFTGMKKFLYPLYPVVDKKGMILVFCMVWIANFGTGQLLEISKSMQPGLQAIELIPNKNRIHAERSAGAMLELYGEIMLKNHSDESREFYVLCEIPEFIQEHIIAEKSLFYEEGSTTPKRVYLPPKSTTVVTGDFYGESNQASTSTGFNGFGSINSVILFDENEQIRLKSGWLFGDESNDKIAELPEK